MESSFQSFKLNTAHSLYLLGQKSSSSHRFNQYRSLIQMCADQGEFLSFEKSSEWLSCFERDSQILHAKLPLIVFRPHSSTNIAPFIKACHQLDLSVTIRCGGTGLMGSCVPATEGVVLLTGHLKGIRKYDFERGMISLEPGVTVRQLNQYVEADHWFFPLSMATEGVAGIAGCLSSHARGYHQQQQNFYDIITSVILVDGQGHILEVPSSLVCGAEGLWGVIIEINLQLKRRPHQRQEFMYRGSWQEMLAKLSLLRSLHSLSFVAWTRDCFYLGLEGEAWRLTSSISFLTQHLPGIEPLSTTYEQLNRSFLPSRKSFIILTSAFNSMLLPEACQRSLAEARHLDLECFQQVDLLAGSLQLILQSEDSLYVFGQKVEQFFVSWADYVDRQQGKLASCHGVGMQMRPYMTPFWTEETRQYWNKLEKTFDPKNLFGKERFFPCIGKSLERVRESLIEVE